MTIRWDGKALNIQPISREDADALEAFAQSVREKCIGPLMNHLHSCALSEEMVRAYERRLLALMGTDRYPAPLADVRWRTAKHCAKLLCAPQSGDQI